MDLGIRDRNAIVCASSGGLGRACAEALAREGVHVVLNGRDPVALKETAEAIRARHDVQVDAVAGDIAEETTRQALLEACPAPDILVNNNGGPAPGRFADWERDAWIDALDANMLAPLAMIRLVLREARRRDPSRTLDAEKLITMSSGPALHVLGSGSSRAGG